MPGEWSEWSSDHLEDDDGASLLGQVETTDSAGQV